MENLKIEPTLVVLDKERSLYYGHRARVQIERECRKRGLTNPSPLKAEFWPVTIEPNPADPDHPIVKQGDDDFMAERLMICLWGGLLKDDPSLTVEAVEKLVDDVPTMYVMEKVTEAMARSNPVKKSDPTGPAPTPATTTISS